MENVQLRTDVLKSGITYTRLAKEIGIHRVSLSRIMSKPLSRENQLRIYDALARIRSGSVPGEADHGSGS